MDSKSGKIRAMATSASDLTHQGLEREIWEHKNPDETEYLYRGKVQ